MATNLFHCIGTWVIYFTFIEKLKITAELSKARKEINALKKEKNVFAREISVLKHDLLKKDNEF